MWMERGICSTRGISLFWKSTATTPQPFPFPQDCSYFNASSSVPKWYSECATTPSGCFSILVPKEREYNVGNTTFGSSPSGGVNWCIDHLQGYIYNRIVDPNGAMYYEIDDILGKPPAPQCRFLVGAETDGRGIVVYHARTYDEAGLTCDLKKMGQPAAGVTLYQLTVTPTTVEGK